jgi:hypothetical protein
MAAFRGSTNWHSLMVADPVAVVVTPLKTFRNQQFVTRKVFWNLGSHSCRIAAPAVWVWPLASNFRSRISMNSSRPAMSAPP